MAYFGVFLQTEPQFLKTFFEKYKCVHRPRTRRHLCAKFMFLRLSFEISFGENTHPPTQTRRLFQSIREICNPVSVPGLGWMS